MGSLASIICISDLLRSQHEIVAIGIAVPLRHRVWHQTSVVIPIEPRYDGSFYRAIPVSRDAEPSQLVIPV